MHLPHARAARLLPLIVLVLLVSGAKTDPARGDSGALLYSTEGNRLRRYDIDSIGSGRLVDEVFIDRASAGAGSSASGGPGRDVNGVVCLFPDGSGRFVAGEDSGQPTPPAGWGVFDAEGLQIGKLTATYQVAGAEPFGCAFDPATNALYTTSVGDQGIGAASGQLIKWSGPLAGYARFPGPPGAYPATNAPSDNFCKVAVDIGTAAEVLVHPSGDVFVAASGALQLLRFRIPPGKSLDPSDPSGGCTATDPQGSPMVDATVTSAPDFRTVLVSADAKMFTFSGLALAPNGNLYVSSVLTGRIAEYQVDGTFVRFILDPPDPPFGGSFTLPISTGNPQSLDVGPDGTLYYADLDLQGTLPSVGPGPNGKVRQVRFDALGEPLAPEIVREHLEFPDGVAVLPGDLEAGEWLTLAGGPDRLFFQPEETVVDAANVGDLVPRWQVLTGAVVTASPTVALVDVPGEGLTRVVYVLSWDLSLWAVRQADGSVLWKLATEDQPGASFPATASVLVERVDDRDVVLVGQGEIFYALDAATGSELWRFTAGTGCRDALGDPPGLCGFAGERNQIESSAIVSGDKVFFGYDVNDVATGKGGFFALDVRTGAMAWFFDLESGQTCRPLPGDDVRAYDAYHGASELGLPADFFTTRPGCDHPRSANGCGNVWSSPALDEERGQIFVASSNCDMPIDPVTMQPETMPPYDEAIFSLTTEGDPVWVWRPRRADNDDLAFGAVPNLFTITLDLGGTAREIDVVGIGGKDGTYYVLDRDGVNEATGAAWDDDPASHLPADLPYWSTQVVPGGDIGGILSTASVDEASRQVHFCTAPGQSGVNDPPGAPQTPTAHSLDLDDGSIVWQGGGPQACFSSVSATPGLVTVGTAVGAQLQFFAPASGASLGAFNLSNFGQGSAPVFVDGTILVGAGIGTRTSTGSGPSDFAANVASNVSALCVPGTGGCAACNDGLDNDGDGLVDAAEDDGCVDDRDHSELLGDLDYNGLVDARDEARFQVAYGTQPGDVGFVHAADLVPSGGGDGVIDDDDYQRWLIAYEEANGGGPAVPLLMPSGAGLLALAMALVSGWAGRHRPTRP